MLLCVSYKLIYMQSTPTERLTCFLDPDLVTEIRVLAARNRKNISDVINDSVRYYLKNYKFIQPVQKKKAGAA